ncbi:MAG: hypothetical protein KAY59_12525, partial [Acidobacteria bacterium]|nr:hypothetical protein [Acidobacteriota bacterium]
MAKRGSRSESRRFPWGALAALLLLAAVRLSGRPVVAAFTDGAADGRSFQALRLTVDLGGRERTVQLTVSLPPGARLAPELTEFVAGGRVHVQILNVYVPGSAAAGPFTVRGSVIDGTRRWPFEATIRVRSNPKVRVIDEETGLATVRAEETVHRGWRATNGGNTMLELRAAATPTNGTVLTVAPEQLRLAPGE